MQYRNAFIKINYFINALNKNLFKEISPSIFSIQADKNFDKAIEDISEYFFFLHSYIIKTPQNFTDCDNIFEI